MAMIFFPLVLDGIINVIWEDGTRWHILALGMTGIISSHILSSVMATLMCILCCIVGLRNLAIHTEAHVSVATDNIDGSK